MEGFTIEQLIELSGENAPRLYRQPLASGDSGAHTWEVRIVRGGAAVDLTGCTATLNVRRDGDSDEATLRKRATIAGNRVSCELPRGVYELGGKLTAVMVVEDSAGRVVTAAVLLLRGKQYITDHIADPDGTLPSVPELLQRVAAMEGAVSQLKNDVIDKSSIGDAWVSGKTYAVGDYCIWANALYKCKTAHTAGSAFSTYYWKRTTVQSEIKQKMDFPVCAFDFDNTFGRNIVVANSSSSGTKPVGIEGNQYLVLSYNQASGGIGMQLAIGFGSNKIAVRNKPYTAESTSVWTDWRYI